MDFKIQHTGLNELLSRIYGSDTTLNTLLTELGFERSQIEQLQAGHLESVVNQFLELIHERLTSDSGKDTYYQILSWRFGLDGEPRRPMSEIADQHGFSLEYLRQLLEEILQRCHSKTWQTDLRKSLKHIVIAQLAKMHERPAREVVAAKLERLSSLRDAVEVARLDYEARKNEILKQIQAELDALDTEYQPVLEAAEENIAVLENEIKTEVLLYGASVSGGAYRAVYNHGRVSWDNDSMTKYAASHPEVLQFRRQGPPIVSLRVVSKN